MNFQEAKIGPQRRCISLGMFVVKLRKEIETESEVHNFGEKREGRKRRKNTDISRTKP